MPEEPSVKRSIKPEDKSPDVREPSNMRPASKPIPDEFPRRESAREDQIVTAKDLDKEQVDAEEP